MGKGKNRQKQRGDKAKRKNDQALESGGTSKYAEKVKRRQAISGEGSATRRLPLPLDEEWKAPRAPEKFHGYPGALRLRVPFVPNNFRRSHAEIEAGREAKRAEKKAP